ncbi:MAG: hypothetical protein K1Y01_13265, partial [Vicinamibacteria bacterium]|nr:hypothetical protein [Vicinamibacteria bacterium]
MRGRVALVALALAGAAFQFPRPMTLVAADPLVSGATFRDFHPPEGGLRWSSDHSAIVFPDPGPGIPVRVELLLSAWRPAGQDGPRVVLTAGGRSTTIHPGAGAERVTLDTTTSGWWRSDLELGIHSDVFEPGQGDARRLGIRVEEARLVPLARGPRVPPLGALLGTALLSLLVAFVLERTGVGPKNAERAALVAGAVIAVLYAVARPFAALWLGPSLILMLAIGSASILMPRSTRAAAAISGAAARALMTGAARLRDIHVATLVALAVVLVSLAYRAPSRIDIDLGSGREVAVAQGFGSFVGKGGEKARWAPRGARLDLSDFGGGAPWKIEAAAALEGAPRDVAVLGAGGRELRVPLQESRWTTASMSAPSPFGWRSGLMLDVPGGSDLLRIDRVSIERGAALPSLRVVLAVVCAALLALIGFGAAGLSVRSGRMAAAALLIGCALAIGGEPVAAIPFTFRFLAIIAAAAGLAAMMRGAVSFFDDGTRLLPGPVAIGAAASGFAAWLTATAFPFYRGGHFVFHSSIAEEIWKGRFLIYYLPYPGSMLSEQAQWGKIVMPHPALYQTLVSPLSALPKPWFYLSEKVFLASLFASLVLMASVVAERVWGKRAAAFAAVLFAGLVPGFQLLGLGHLMTILGVWSSSLVLPWLMFRVDALDRFKTWLATAWLFTFCFLSYTAALLFTGAVLVWVILMTARENFPRARSVFTMLVAASAFAFLLYYVHWTLPFLMQSVPKIMGGAGLGGKAAEATPILSRLALEPGKLSYSYGSMLIPLLGALSLLRLPRSWDRLILLSWMGILFFVSGIDLFFNFLLKHH